MQKAPNNAETIDKIAKNAKNIAICDWLIVKNTIIMIMLTNAHVWECTKKH